MACITDIPTPEEMLPSAALLAGPDELVKWQRWMLMCWTAGDYPDVSPFDGYLLKLSPRWKAYLDAKALEVVPKPPVPVSFTEPLFTIRQSAKGGHGAFASQDISEGTEIHSELPLLSSKGYGAELEKQFRALPDAAKADLVRMAYWDNGDGGSKLEHIFAVNCFRCGDHSRIFKVACRFNHACRPKNNVEWTWTEEIGKIVFTASSAIKKDEELTISYGHDPWDFPPMYGFQCDCGCDPIELKKTETEKERMTREKLNKHFGASEQRWLDAKWRQRGQW